MKTAALSITNNIKILIFITYLLNSATKLSRTVDEFKEFFLVVEEITINKANTIKIKLWNI